jgi:hypothetical protein
VQIFTQETPKRVANVLFNRAVEDSANYAELNMQDALIFFDESQTRCIPYVAQNILPQGYVAEFGVWRGYSINLTANALPSRQVFGFDSFYGLAEDWRGWEFSKGDFSLDGKLPEVVSNVTLIKGYFQDSLKPWLAENTESFAYIHMDCDTYESTSFVLNTIGAHRLVEGTLILFDEYFGYHNWRNHEFKAWQEFVAENKIEYEYLALNHLQVLVRVKALNKV